MRSTSNDTFIDILGYYIHVRLLITWCSSFGWSAIEDKVDMKKQSPIWPCFTE